MLGEDANHNDDDEILTIMMMILTVVGWHGSRSLRSSSLEKKRNQRRVSRETRKSLSLAVIAKNLANYHLLPEIDYGSHYSSYI